MISLEEICNKNRENYSQFEETYERSLKQFQSRIFPNQNAEYLQWYYIKVNDQYIGSIWIEQENKASQASLGVFIAYEEFRNLGYGKEAIKQILQKAAQSGIFQVHLRVRVQNIRALNCYKNIGFEVVNVIKKNDIPVYEMVYNTEHAL